MLCAPHFPAHTHSSAAPLQCRVASPIPPPACASRTVTRSLPPPHLHPGRAQPVRALGGAV
eukprot:scaffold8006_cov113-Isochrysis_galbana.AAC.2